MFFAGSRYAAMGQYTVARKGGTVVIATRLPLPGAVLPRGYYQRKNSQRLDGIAAHFLSDATAFWRLCDTNRAPMPDALARHALIGIAGGS